MLNFKMSSSFHMPCTNRPLGNYNTVSEKFAVIHFYISAHIFISIPVHVFVVTAFLSLDIVWRIFQTITSGNNLCTLHNKGCADKIIFHHDTQSSLEYLNGPRNFLRHQNLWPPPRSGCLWLAEGIFVLGTLWRRRCGCSYAPRL